MNSLPSTPLMKLIRTPRAFYFYETNHDTIIEISEELYQYFSESNYTKIPTPALQQEIDYLKKAGHLSTHRVQEIRHPETDELAYKANHFMTQLLLQVTQACNLCCIYCAYANNGNSELQRKHSSKMMTFETAKKAIDFYAEHSDGVEHITISFYGGEPLIAFPLIEQCVAYADELFEGKEILYSITTNGTLLNDAISLFFKNHHFNVTFSVDGPKHIHNKNRLRSDGSPTYDTVMRNLQKLVTLYGADSRDKLSINMVINPADDLDDIFEWLEDPLLTKINVITNLISNDMLNEKFDNYDLYIEKYEYHLAMGYLNTLHVVDNLDYSFVVEQEISSLQSMYWEMKYCQPSLPDCFAPSGPCIPGQRKLFVTNDGNFYPCEKVSEKCKDFIIGNIDDGYNYPAMERVLNIAQLTPEACKNCWAFRQCSVCEKHAAGGEHLSASAKLSFCQTSKDSFYRQLQGCILLNEGKKLYKHSSIAERNSL